MIDLIVKPKCNFDVSPNELLPINDDYVYLNSKIGFGELNKTNLFIGENNSGKSRFLRGLFVTDFYGIRDLNIFNSNLLKQVLRGLERHPEGNLKIFDFLYERLKDQYFANNVPNTFFKVLKGYSNNYSIKDKYYFPILRGSKNYKQVIREKLKVFLNKATTIQSKDSVNHFLDLLTYSDDGLDTFDLYCEIIYNEYFKQQKKDIKNYILTGGMLYSTIKGMLLNKVSERNKIQAFQQFMQDHFFDGQELVLTPNESEKVLYVKIGGEEKPIFDFGDGIQQLITILFYLFIHKDEENKLFFIEEPEMYLHPGILRRFIEVINSDVFKNHQYFITTHSNTVLDVSADINIKMSIFKFKKIGNPNNKVGTFQIEQCSNGDVSLLNEIGVRNSSLFLSNCSIWVEGTTDRLYFKHYLHLYCKKFNKKEFREGLDYSFIEYGGGNIVHYNFSNTDFSMDTINARYINQKIFVIADNDSTKEGTRKYERKKKLKEMLGERFYELPVKEVENLISKEVLKRGLIQQNTNQEQIIEVKFNKINSYESVGLGKYIDDKFVGTGVKKYGAESGTIKDKLNFCKDVIGCTLSYDELSKQAKDLVEAIYGFIVENN